MFQFDYKEIYEFLRAHTEAAKKPRRGLFVCAFEKMITRRLSELTGKAYDTLTPELLRAIRESGQSPITGTLYAPFLMWKGLGFGGETVMSPSRGTVWERRHVPLVWGIEGVPDGYDVYYLDSHLVKEGRTFTGDSELRNTYDGIHVAAYYDTAYVYSENVFLVAPSREVYLHEKGARFLSAVTCHPIPLNESNFIAVAWHVLESHFMGFEQNQMVLRACANALINALDVWSANVLHKSLPSKEGEFVLLLEHLVLTATGYLYYLEEKKAEEHFLELYNEFEKMFFHRNNTVVEYILDDYFRSSMIEERYDEPFFEESAELQRELDRLAMEEARRALQNPDVILDKLQGGEFFISDDAPRLMKPMWVDGVKIYVPIVDVKEMPKYSQQESVEKFCFSFIGGTSREVDLVEEFYFDLEFLFDRAVSFPTVYELSFLFEEGGTHKVELVVKFDFFLLVLEECITDYRQPRSAFEFLGRYVGFYDSKMKGATSLVFRYYKKNKQDLLNPQFSFVRMRKE